LNEILAVLLVLLLASSGYAAGRMHGQYSYHVGYRFGYRHGYYDGDRASWNRRRRELQNAVASVLKEPAALDDLGPPDRSVGTTYASASYADTDAGTAAALDADTAAALDAEPDSDGPVPGQAAAPLVEVDVDGEPTPEVPVEGGGRHSAAGARFLTDHGHGEPSRHGNLSRHGEADSA
jgi:hypothetical protein